MGLFVVLVEVLVCILLIWWILRQKTGEKFSKKFVAKTLVLGCLAVIAIMAIGGFIPKNAFAGIGNPILKGFVMILATASIIEEFFKYVLFRLSLIGNDEVKTIHDAVLASCLVALGFTLFEDAYYGMSGNLFTLFRVLFPAHIVFAAVMGYFYGKAKVTGKRKYHWLSFLIPVLLHTVFDTPIAIIQVLQTDAAASEVYSTPVTLTWLVITIAFLVLIILTFIRIKRGATDSRLQIPLVNDEQAKQEGE